MTSSLKDIPKEQWHLIHGGEVCMWGEKGGNRGRM